MTRGNGGQAGAAHAKGVSQMFRLSMYLKGIIRGCRHEPRAARGDAARAAPMVIWNLTRRCNLACAHCYAAAKDRPFHGELSTAQARAVIEQLRNIESPVVIFSGGEPLLRPGLFELAAHARGLGQPIALSTNGALIDETMAWRVASAGFGYVGISLDGLRETHDRFRGMPGAFDLSVNAMRLLKARGVKVGARFTLTRATVADLPGVFELCEQLGVDKLYLSHLVYSGRGQANRDGDLTPPETRRVMEFVVERALRYVKENYPLSIVTGNNDADGVFTYLTLARIEPDLADRILPLLWRWGGASAGVGVANIDPLGEVHPDPLMSNVSLGNVTQKSFGEIWYRSCNSTLARLRKRPRTFNGRCGRCAWLDMCGGSVRVRALRAQNDLWGSDPACYLTDEEIGAVAAHAT